VPRYQSDRSDSSLRRGKRAPTLIGIIINKNLKILLINFLLEKWMFSFIFLLDHNIFGTELTAGLFMYICIYL